MLKNLLTILIITFCMASCTLYQIDSEDISTDFYPSKKSSSEVVYIESVDRPHEMIGKVIVNAERNQRISEIIEKMKREAAILGGDAIMDLKSDATGTWKSMPVQDFIKNGYIRADFKSTIIVFK